jgi:excisionase family DNA binding protein
MTERPMAQPHSTLDYSSERFLSPVEAADYLNGIHPRTITRWAREGYLPAYPIGEGKRRLWRFRCRDLEQWLLARREHEVGADA